MSTGINDKRIRRMMGECLVTLGSGNVPHTATLNIKDNMPPALLEKDINIAALSIIENMSEQDLVVLAGYLLDRALVMCCHSVP